MIVYDLHNGARIVTTLQTVEETRLLTLAISTKCYATLMKLFSTI